MPTQTKLIVALVSVALLAGGVALSYQRGYSHGYDFAKTKGDAALQQWQSAQAIASAGALKQANDRYAGQVLRANQAEQALLDTRQQLAQQSQHLKEQIDAVTQIYRIAPGAAPQALPQCVFTRGFVRLWNAAAGADDGRGAVSSGASVSGAAAATDPADAFDSGVSQADVLDWFTDYATRTRGLETQLNQVLDVEQGNQQDQPGK